MGGSVGSGSHCGVGVGWTIGWRTNCVDDYTGGADEDNARRLVHSILVVTDTVAFPLASVASDVGFFILCG